MVESESQKEQEQNIIKEKCYVLFIDSQNNAKIGCMEDKG